MRHHFLLLWRRYFYVQRTEASAPFFLAHRELAIHLQFPSGTAFGMADAPAVPWLIFGNGGTVQPPGGPKTCDPNVMGRLAALSICERRECTVCLQVRTRTPSSSRTHWRMDGLILILPV